MPSTPFQTPADKQKEIDERNAQFDKYTKISAETPGTAEYVRTHSKQFKPDEQPESEDFIKANKINPATIKVIGRTTGTEGKTGIAGLKQIGQSSSYYTGQTSDGRTLSWVVGAGVIKHTPEGKRYREQPVVMYGQQNEPVSPPDTRMSISTENRMKQLGFTPSVQQPSDKEYINGVETLPSMLRGTASYIAKQEELKEASRTTPRENVTFTHFGKSYNAPRIEAGDLVPAVAEASLGAAYGIITLPESTARLGHGLVTKPVETITEIPKQTATALSSPFGFGAALSSTYVGGKVGNWFTKSGGIKTIAERVNIKSDVRVSPEFNDLAGVNSKLALTRKITYDLSPAQKLVKSVGFNIKPKTVIQKGLGTFEGYNIAEEGFPERSTMVGKFTSRGGEQPIVSARKVMIKQPIKLGDLEGTKYGFRSATTSGVKEVGGGKMFKLGELSSTEPLTTETLFKLQERSASQFGGIKVARQVTGNIRTIEEPTSEITVIEQPRTKPAEIVSTAPEGMQWAWEQPKELPKPIEEGTASVKLVETSNKPISIKPSFKMGTSQIVGEFSKSMKLPKVTTRTSFGLPLTKLSERTGTANTFRLASKSATSTKEATRLQQITTTSTLQTTRTRTHERTGLSLMNASATLTNNTQATKQTQSFARISPQINMTTPSFTFQLSNSSGFKRESKKRRKGFNVLIRRKGKFSLLAKNLPEGLAFSRGQRAVGSTLAATFRVVPSGGSTELLDIPKQINRAVYRQPFGRSKLSFGGGETWIQKAGGRREPTVRGARLSSLSERSEIKQAGRASRISLFGSKRNRLW